MVKVFLCNLNVIVLAQEIQYVKRIGCATEGLLSVCRKMESNQFDRAHK